MAGTTYQELFVDRIQHAGSVLALSFSAFEIRPTPKDGGHFKGNFLANAPKPILYLGKPVMMVFYTGMHSWFPGPTALSFRPRAIPWRHARLSQKVWSKLPQLLPDIHLKLKERMKEMAKDETMARELINPSIVFNSAKEEPTDVWTFEVDQPSSDMGHYVKFRGLELIDSYSIG